MKLLLEVEPGETIQDACREAQNIADKVLMPVEFEFNGVECVAAPDGDPITLHARWREVTSTKPRVCSLDD